MAFCRRRVNTDPGWPIRILTPCRMTLANINTTMQGVSFQMPPRLGTGNGTAGLQALVGEAFGRLAAGLCPRVDLTMRAPTPRKLGTRRLFSCGFWFWRAVMWLDAWRPFRGCASHRLFFLKRRGCQGSSRGSVSATQAGLELFSSSIVY